MEKTKLIATLNDAYAVVQSVVREVEKPYDEQLFLEAVGADAAAKRQRILDILSRINAISQTLIQTQQELIELISPMPKTVLWSITDGAINQSYLAVSPLIKENLVRVGDHVKLIFPSLLTEEGKSAVAEAVVKKSSFSCRGIVARLYEVNGAGAEDVIRFTQLEEGVFQVDFMDDESEYDEEDILY